MKTIIELILRISGPFVVALFVFNVNACKKSTTKPEPIVNTPGPVTPAIDSVQYTLTVNSNFLRSYVGIDNLTTGQEIKRFNVQGNDVNCPITYSFWARSDKHYYINTYSTKNSSDSTLYMTDNKHVWNKLTVTKGSTVVYDKKDSIGSGTWPIAINNYHINQ